MAMALINLGFKSKSYSGHQVKIETDGAHSKARILNIEDTNLKKDLKNGFIAVVAGFQGVDKKGNITTLGRGGSDTTAVALAAALKAEECQIYTDVDGIYTTDPRVVPEAKKLKSVNFEEMLEMASLGSKVLQTRSVEFAGKYKVKLRVLSSFSPIMMVQKLILRKKRIWKIQLFQELLSIGTKLRSIFLGSQICRVLHIKY